MNSYELTRNPYATVTDQGLGQPMGDESSYQEGLLLHAIFIIEICWGVVIWIVKYSILAFYWRLFSASRRSTRIIIWTLAAFVTCWGISVVCFRLLMLGLFAGPLR